MRTDQIIISGFGGQGIVAAGRVLVYAGMADKKKVSMLPSYGPEMRGGFANCHVILSDSDIASPIISKADVVMAMSVPASYKFEDAVKPGKFFIVDSHLVLRTDYRKDIQVIEIPASRLAMEAGNIRFANVVMIGALMAVTGIPSLPAIKEAIKALLPGEKEALYKLEMEALLTGMKYINQSRRFMYA